MGDTAQTPGDAGAPEPEKPPEPVNPEPRDPLSPPLKDTWDGALDPLEALREGRQGPFEAFVRTESRRFLAFFDRLGAPRAEAEDLVQETFLKLFRLAASPDTAYAAQGRFLPFALRVAKNAWIDRRRRNASRPRSRGSEAEELALERAASGAPAPGTVLETNEESARIRAAVDALSDTHRLVFELGVFEERPYAEISEILEIPVGTVKSRMHNAVRKVRAALEAPAAEAAPARRAQGGTDR